MADNNSDNRFKKNAIFLFKNIVNIIFACLGTYYAVLAFVLQIAPQENKLMLAGVLVLWLFCIFAKAIITLVLSLIVIILLTYGWYYYTHYEQINCKNSGGVWNEQKQICEEKIDLLKKIKDVWENRTFLKFSTSENQTDKTDKKHKE